MNLRAGELYRRIGDPWKSLQIFHIAGTNGKGSISSYLTHMLCKAGHRVGWYTSPYLEQFNERIRILDGSEDLARYDRDQLGGEIPDETIDRLMRPIQKAARDIVNEGGARPTQFDLITALAFSWYAEQHCDVVVLETGLGGRLDSTNVIEKPVASLIAAPGFDHMDRLGNTMEEIMWEKAGIVKQGRPVYAYDPSSSLISERDADAARLVLEERAAALSAPLTFLGYGDIERLDYGWHGQTFLFKKTGQLFSTRLLGTYHPVYAMLAAAAVADAGLGDERAIREGIASTIWPARLEVLSTSPFFLLDGAHNWQAGLALEEALAGLSEGRPIVLLTGVLRHKDYRRLLSGVLSSDRYNIVSCIATEPPGERSLSAYTLKEEIEKLLSFVHGAHAEVTAEPSVKPAMDLAIRLAEEHRAMVCAFGSLYLAGEIKTIFRERGGLFDRAHQNNQEAI